MNSPAGATIAAVSLRSFPALVLVAALACGGCSRKGEEPGEWQRFDLTRATPQIEAQLASEPLAAVVSYLGAREVRDMDRVPEASRTAFRQQSAGQVRSLEQEAGSRLAWRVHLGDRPVWTFTPLPDLDHPCACTFRAGLRSAEGALIELFRLASDELFLSPSPPPTVAPRGSTAEVELDLGRWAGQEVDLLLQVDSAPGGSRRGAKVRWASPALYHRTAAADRATGTAKKPNIVLIGIDTLRADHLGPLPATQPNSWRGPTLTPALDRLAADSDVWLDAYSTFNVTNPSFVSILTGLYGKNHGVYDLRTPLPDGHTTLAELLHDAGYATLAVISARHLGDHNSGLGQGFDQVVTATEHAAAEMAVATAMDWISRQSGPYFVWLHLFDPHTPHVPPQPYASGLRPAQPYGLGRVESWVPFRPVGPVTYEQPVLGGHRDLYAGEVAYLDRQLDRLIDFLDSRGARRNTLLALTADHGENLGEHGILHRHGGLWETTTHVPLMIRWPSSAKSAASGAGTRQHGLVQTLDLFPTLLAAAGIEPPLQDGEDLRQLTAEGRRGRRVIFSEHASLLGLTVRSSTHRLMKSAGNPQIPDGSYLYDLSKDPGETHNLTGLASAVEQRLSQLLANWVEDRQPRRQALPRNLSDEEIERLRALGYL